MDDISAECFGGHALVRMNVTISQCSGQCYDGASKVHSSRNGVAVHISSEEKCAVFTHCYGHALNLAISDCVKKCKVCSDALDVAFEITKLIKFSPKRNAAFDHIREESEKDSGM